MPHAVPTATPPTQIDREPDKLHHRLTAMNRRRFSPSTPNDGWDREFAGGTILMRQEHHFLESERRAIARRAASAPRDPVAFLAWFETLKLNGPGQHDPLFPWLATHASLDQMRWFLKQEVAGEAGFDDLVALTQLGMGQRAKLELARNYWDEMGRGNAKGMHGPMLKMLSDALELEACPAPIVWEALALANTMAGLAADRHYAFHSIGALGVIELTAPGRASKVGHGLTRLGVGADDRHYFDLHAILDVKHSEAWNREIILPLIEEDSARAPLIAEGALMRLSCGARCFERYRREFGL
jgi:hypothetical protein